MYKWVKTQRPLPLSQRNEMLSNLLPYSQLVSVDQLTNTKLFFFQGQSIKS